MNYFGLQRFGTGATSNAIVGEAVLKAATGRGEWKAVSDLILGARARDEPREVEAKAHYAAGRLREAVDAMPRRQRVERGLLEGLVRHGANAHLSAFETLPKNLRLMYVHAWRPGVFASFLEPLVWFGLRRAAVRDFALRAKAMPFVACPACTDEALTGTLHRAGL